MIRRKDLNTSEGVILPSEPTTQVTNIYIQQRTTARINIAFTAGDGDGRLVIYKQGTTNTDVPTDGTVYAVGDIVGTSTVEAIGNITTASQTGLTNNTYYTFNVFEYNGTTTPNYNTTLVTNENRKYIKTLP